MKLSIFNGSPRGKASNSSVINKWLTEASKDSEHTIEIKEELIIKDVKKHLSYIEEIEASQKVIMTFPLYADGMPGVVMEFFELMYAHRDRLKNTQYLFVIHSGFPEAKHSYALRDYLKAFTHKMDGQLFNIIIYGGSEGTRLAPVRSQKKKRTAFNDIGLAFATNQPIAQKDRKRLSKPEELSVSTQIILKLLSKTPLLNMYWDRSMKDNNVFGQSFDQPYLNK